MTTKSANPSNRSRSLGIMLAWLAGLIFAGLIVLRVFVYEPRRTPSDSMYPTLPSGSFLIIDKRGFGGPLRQLKRTPTATIQRGEVLVFYVDDEGTMYVKRVIGLPGDHVTLKGHQLTINDTPISVRVASGPLEQVGRLQYQLASEAIDGQEIDIAWIPDRPSPDFDAVVPEGHYFMLGDNRDNSRDSRYPEVGFIPKENLIGTVVKVLTPAR